MFNTKALLIVCLLVLVILLLWDGNPRTVNAQAGVSTQPSCTTANSGSTSIAAGVGGSYPVFACTADLDGTGGSQVIVGFISAVTPAAPTQFFKVTIINANGTVRATVPVN